MSVLVDAIVMNVGLARIQEIARSAKINDIDVDGNTPVHHAVKSCDLDVVNFLVERGARIDHENEHGQTPLIIAVMHNRIDIVEYLVDHGAIVEYQADDGNDAISWSMRLHRFDILNLLMNVVNASSISHPRIARKLTGDEICIISHDPIENREEYRKCVNVKPHLYKTKMWERWHSSSDNDKCCLCNDPIDTTIYINKWSN